MREFKHIKINGNNYPIRCNIRVLGEIQMIYGSLSKFELDLRGIKVTKDKTGKEKQERKPRSWTAIAVALPLMVAEGLKLTESELPNLTGEQIIDGVDNINLAAATLTEEFKDCFLQKK